MAATRLDRADFGPNTWLIDEMHRAYVEDPASVGEAWRDFFAGYQPRTPLTAPAAPAPAVPPPAEPPAALLPGGRPPDGAARNGGLPASGRPAVEDGVALRGAAKVAAERMNESLSVPTATSIRTVPARLLEVNRTILNVYLQRTGGGKVSFTHLIGWAVARALAEVPAMNSVYRVVDRSPQVVRSPHVNLGLAIDVKKADGSRGLVVPNIREAQTLGFRAFFTAYEDLIRRSASGGLRPEDFAGTTVTITNPGTIGTVASVPRLMAGQAAIIGVGSIDYPAEWAGADPQRLADIGVGKVLTLTSTYDHRVIQGAESGEFLSRVNGFLVGEEHFYEDVFRAMGAPYVPTAWRRDLNPPSDSREGRAKQGRVRQLINMYRVRGHLMADLDPLAAKPPEMHPELDPASYDFTIWDLDRTFDAAGLAGKRELTLSEILGILLDAYCRRSSAEYMHSQEPDEKRWIQTHVEGVTSEISPHDMRRILEWLSEAEVFERFMHTKYVGHKRFSLEGAESMIPVLHSILDMAADTGLEEAVIGMAHRGRLNVLANIIGKSYSQIFREFEGDIDPNSPLGSGDVQYHTGATGKHLSEAGRAIQVTVAPNPSHLESVDPVVEGMVRAKLDALDRVRERPVLPILIHGDAAFAGQGVVVETLMMSRLKGYWTGGTVHIIVNNQLGFTTGPGYGRSSTYASDVAKVIQAPVLHVNGDDPEACIRMARLAFEYRQRFRRDVVIDMWCYRRWGHNESDEPAFTQPLMYRAIDKRRSVRKLYTEALVNRGDLGLDEAEQFLEAFRGRLQQAFDETKAGPGGAPAAEPGEPLVRMGGGLVSALPAPAVEPATLNRVVDALVTVPDGFDLHPKLRRWLDSRAAALKEDAVDWSLAEALAFGSLLTEGRTVRLAGQDTRRGTFSQRHSVLVDQTTAAEYTPLVSLAGGFDGGSPGSPARFYVIDSPLSEMAALGFEYGYAVANPEALVLWEAQFGDFADGAQVIIDTYLASAERKWGQGSGLVLLLPHGYDGQGPDHSSARLERFLQLSAEGNLRVIVPTTAAQYFHALRQHAYQRPAVPLVVMTPKSLLRLAAARSPVGELTGGAFEEVLGDPAPPEEVRRVVLTQGKVFYDLLAARDQRKAPVAVVRIEQPYPFPASLLREQLGYYPGAEVCWVQEEPENMGSWRFLQPLFSEELGVPVAVIARPPAASPATGSLKVHVAEQQALVERALEGLG
ncbi:MAG TPA: multifunctional oxoglutarate decarboxylase/oxoglutarate dehydrogenase thiamine pyrophosphate-binding subunit/dihydrolipoyllysine-residue succinyltransferase subunit [Actinomycetota bacterium]|nr:multifunctional oxoglutarate decarboxylase/oxoglutarate dehydrogenase thiamine pyrophosphate-binding subunit/dihydrolipoyllysine-residue succinyltransferase subunit [Actinomycetota bacterium]